LFLIKLHVIASHRCTDSKHIKGTLRHSTAFLIVLRRLNDVAQRGKLPRAALVKPRPPMSVCVAVLSRVVIDVMIKRRC